MISLIVAPHLQVIPGAEPLPVWAVLLAMAAIVVATVWALRGKR